MTLENYLIFVSASILLCIIPGPDMAHLLVRSIAQGKKAGFIAALGINAGAYVHLVAAVIGLSTILVTSAFVFTIVKWLGAIYLIYIGIQAFRNRGTLNLKNIKVKGKQSRVIFWQGFFSDALNPKVAIFYLAFLPQFVTINSNNLAFELMLLGVTVNVIGILINILLVYFAANITTKLRANSSYACWLNRAMGTLFIALGFKLASERQI